MLIDFLNMFQELDFDVIDVCYKGFKLTLEILIILN